MGIEYEVIFNVVSNCITIAIALLILTAVLYVIRSMLNFVATAFHININTVLKGIANRKSKFKESGLND